MKGRIFFGTILSFAFGIILETATNYGYSGGLFLLLISISLFSLYLILLFLEKGQEVIEKTDKAIFAKIALLFLFMSLGFFRSQIYYSSFENAVTDIYEGENITIKGIVIEDPEIRNKTQKVIFLAKEIGKEDGYETVSDKIVAFFPLYPKLIEIGMFFYGKTLVL